MRLYFEIRERDSRSTFYIVRQIALELGYTLDINGSNSHVMKVVREYFDKAQPRDLCLRGGDAHVPSYGNCYIAT